MLRLLNFHHEILQRYNSSFVKLSLCNNSFLTQSIPIDPKYSIIRRLRELSGSLVECLTQYCVVGDWSLTGITVLCP